MSTKELLINEIEQVPEPLLNEVLDFVHFLKAKIIREGIATAVASEPSLEKTGSEAKRMKHGKIYER